MRSTARFRLIALIALAACGGRSDEAADDQPTEPPPPLDCPALVEFLTVMVHEQRFTVDVISRETQLLRRTTAAAALLRHPGCPEEGP